MPNVLEGKRNMISIEYSKRFNKDLTSLMNMFFVATQDCLEYIVGERL